MAHGKKTGGRDFKPGVVTNPRGAGAHNKDLQQVRKLTHALVAEVANMVLEGRIDDLEKIIGNKAKGIPPDPTATPLKVWFATIALKGISKGDVHALDVLLNRTVGKVKDKVDVTSSDGSMSPTFVFETANAKKD